MPTELTAKALLSELRRIYGDAGGETRVVFAPYRICPLGAHIDHQLGPVTAMAIDRGVWLAYAAATGTEVRLRSLEFAGEVRFDLARPGPPCAGDWGNFPRGAAQALSQAGHPLRRGLVGVIGGAWSEGGLSSSAAVGIAYLLALEEVNGLSVPPEENIALDQAIENRYLDLRNGILDPAGILLSRQDHLTLVDCLTTRHRLVPAPPTELPSILLAFSGLRQALVGTDYNLRVGECESAARILLKAAGRCSEHPVLGQVSDAEYAACRDQLPVPLNRRAAHFFTEVRRVDQGVAAWQEGDWEGFGRLMTESGESSIRLYECGCPPMIDLYELMVDCPGVYGARFSGAGFRGCCVGLVERGRAPEAVERIRRRYAERHPALAMGASVVLCASGNGAHLPSRAT